MGVKPPTPYSDNKDDAAVIIPIGQSYCSINSLQTENVCLNKKIHSNISVKQSILIKFWNEHSLFSKDTGLEKYMSETVQHHDQNDTGTDKVATFADYLVQYSYQHTYLYLE
jgi:hypothetical protein